MKTSVIAKRGRATVYLCAQGSCAVRIYAFTLHKNGKRYTDHRLIYSDAGTRVRRSFANLDEAKTEAALVLDRMAAGQLAALSLTGADRESYLAANHALSGLSTPLHAAACEYRAASDLLTGRASVLEAARYYAHHVLLDGPVKTVKEVVAEMIDAKTADGLSTVYISKIRERLNKFAKQFDGPIINVKTRDIEAWLRSLNIGPRSRNNRAADITTLFRFARRAGYLPDKTTAADNLAKAKETKEEIAIFTVEEVQRMLNRLALRRPELVPHVAIGCFAGLRMAEIARLNWEDIRFGENVVVVRAQKAKTGARRIIPIQPNLAAWLKPFASMTGPLAPWKMRLQHKISRALVKDLPNDPGVRWRDNGLRHSFATYRLPIIKNAAALALEMGNSPKMIFANYREVLTPDGKAITEADAQAYFAIIPPSFGPEPGPS